MKIIVCIKGVPNSRISKNDSDDEYKLGTKDMYALKTALALKEKYPLDIEVICMAPHTLCGILKRLYIYDINNIYLATDSLFAGADTFVTSFVLHKMIEKIGMADIILCGKSSDDSATAQIGPSLAERLKYQLISNISSIEIDGHHIKCESSLEKIKYIIETKQSIVGTVDCPPIDNRYPSLRNIIRQKKDITIFNAKDLGISKNQTQSKTKVLKLFSYEKAKNGEFITGDISDMAIKFIDIIKLYN
jgi:electron transfer flavoprotein beta subunit